MEDEGVRVWTQGTPQQRAGSWKGAFRVGGWYQDVPITAALMTSARSAELPGPGPRAEGLRPGNQRTRAPPQPCHQPLNLSPEFSTCEVGYSCAFGEPGGHPMNASPFLLPLLSLLSLTHRNLSKQPRCPWGAMAGARAGHLGRRSGWHRDVPVTVCR